MARSVEIGPTVPAAVPLDVPLVAEIGRPLLLPELALVRAGPPFDP